MPYVVFKGGLGNLLFQYSFFLHMRSKIPDLKIDLHSNLSTGVPKKSRFHSIVDNFSEKTKENNTHGIDQSIFSKFIRLLSERFCAKNYFEKYNDDFFSNTKTLSLNFNNYIGYWQNFKYVENNLEKICEDFKKIKLTKVAQLFISKISKYDVAIHIRRGDYTLTKNKRIYHNLNIEYFYNALRTVKINIDFKKIFIFSDDPNLNLDKEFADYELEYFKGSDDIEELIVMSKFYNLIISNSTFSLWAGYLSISKKRTLVAPKNWYINSEKNKTTSNLFSKKWQRI